MRTYIGIDLGTSGIKLLLVNETGEILSESTRGYEVLYPKPGWTEQSPLDWLEALTLAMSELLADQDRSAVRAISFGGQMHGLVVLDESDEVIRPCILWNDGRTAADTAFLNEKVGGERLKALTGNIAFAGFTAPKLLWLKENEPQSFSRIAKIMLPKDYLSYILSGSFASEPSDAAGTLLFDVEKRAWSKEMCDICSVKAEWLPKIYESYEAVGTLKKEYAEKFGLSSKVKIVIGAGDNAGAAIGCGAVTDGRCNISLGTSGTVFIASDKYICGGGEKHSFCHANGKYHLLECILSAASCRKWWIEEIVGNRDYPLDDILAESANTDGLYFLPYLSGERSPHNDVNVRGAFFGLSSDTSRAEMSRAIMEGVAFAVRECIEVSGVSVREATLCGGGAKGNTWRSILASVLGIPLILPVTEQGPAYGAAILAMTADNGENDPCATALRLFKVKETVLPDKEMSKYYNERYRTFKTLYPAIKNLKI